MRNMRLFIAIELSDEMRKAVARIQEHFRRHGVRGNYTPAENLHLTLAFIGEYPDAAQPLEVMQSIPLTPFELELEGVGAFGDLWWVGLKESASLNGYVRLLRRRLAEAGIPFDRKRFAPHITLLRRASAEARRMPHANVEEAFMIVDHAALMRSDRGKHGMIYTQIL